MEAADKIKELQEKLESVVWDYQEIVEVYQAGDLLRENDK